MKKLLLGAALAVSSLTFAQQFGVKAGVNVSNISDDNDVQTNSKTGYYAGVFMNAPIAEDFSIQPEVLYNSVGSKYDYGNASSTLTLDYITVPVMFQYNVVPQFYLEAGPEFGFLVGAKSKVESGSFEGSSDLNKDNFNSFNFGVGLGAGFNITNNIGINARYVAGFTDATDESNQDFGSDADNKNNVFQAGVTFKF
ncbi:porin family protein [Chryseobacterium sp. A321]